MKLKKGEGKGYGGKINHGLLNALGEGKRRSEENEGEGKVGKDWQGRRVAYKRNRRGMEERLEGDTCIPVRRGEAKRTLTQKGTDTGKIPRVN